MMATVLLLLILLCGAACQDTDGALETVSYPDGTGSQVGAAENTAADTAADAAGDSKAPDFTVVDGTGAEVKLSDFVGKPVVLNFWASWCPPCKAEMPDFEEAYKKYKDDVVFMMVDMTDGVQETVDQAQAHIASCGYTFPVYFDTNSEAAYAYYVSSIPQTFFIDAGGNLVAYADSMIDAAALEKGIGMILNP